MKIKLLTLLLLGALTTSLMAQVSNNNIEQYIKLTNMDMVIESMPSTFRSYMNEYILSADDSEKKKKLYNDLIDKFDVMEMKQKLRKYINSHSTDIFIGELINLYNRTGYEEVEYKIKKGVVSPDLQNDKMQFPPDKERVDLTENYVTKSKGAEIKFKSMKTILYSMAKEDEKEKVKQILNKMRPKLSEEFHQKLITMTLAASKDIPINEYRNYVELSTSKLGMINSEFQFKAYIYILSEFSKQIASIKKQH